MYLTLEDTQGKLRVSGGVRGEVGGDGFGGRWKQVQKTRRSRTSAAGRRVVAHQSPSGHGRPTFVYSYVSVT